MASIVNERDRLLNTSTVRVLPTGSNYIYISAPAQYFKVNNNGTSDQESITFTANLVGNLYGDCTFTVVQGSAVLTAAGSNQTTLSFANLSSDSVTIQATLDFFGVVYVAKFTVTKLTNGIIGSSAPVVTLTTEGQIFTVLKNTGAVTPSENLITATVINVPDPQYTWYVDGAIQSGQTSPTFSVASFTGIPKIIRVEVTSADTPMVFDQLTMYSVREGDDSLTIGLENENQTISCDSQGAPLTGQFPISTQLVVLRGAVQLVSGVVYSKVSEIGLVSTINATTGIISVTSITALTGSATYRATITNLNGSTTILERTLSLNKSINGATGLNAAIFSITTSGAIFSKNSSGVVSPTTGIVLSTQYQNITGTISYKWQKNNVDIVGATSLSYTIPVADYASVTTNTYKCLVTGTVNGVANTTISDQITVPLLVDGSSSIQVLNSNETVTFTAPNSGYAGIVFTGGSCTITVYIGTTQLSYGTSGANTFSCIRTATGATVGAGVGSGVTFVLPAPTAISAEVAYTDIAIVVRNSASVATNVSTRINYSLSRAGTNGTNGLSSSVFSITTSGAVFSKNNLGVTNPTAGIVLSTAYQNIATPITYKWQKNGIDIAGATSSSYTVLVADYATVSTNTYKCTVTGTVNGVTNTTLSDQITIPLLVDGASTIQVLNSNENITFTAANTGYDGIIFTGGASTISAYIGTTKLNYALTGASTFNCTAVVVGATVATGIGSGTTFSMPAPTAISSDAAYVDITVTVRNGANVATNITTRITYSLSRAGLNGSTGVNARSVDLTTSRQSFQYEANTGLSPVPVSATVTATARNTVGTVYYEFLLNGSVVSSYSTVNTYTYTPAAAFVNMPDQLQVNVKEGTPATPTSAVLATDTLSMIGLRAGANGSNGVSPVAGFLTNEAATISADKDGVVTPTNLALAGGSFKVYEGITDKTTASTFSVVSQTGINVSITASGASAGVYVVNSMSADSGIVTLRATYGSVVIDRIFNVTKSRTGATGLPAKTMYLTTTSQVFRIDKQGSAAPAEGITLTAVPSGDLTGIATFTVSSGTATLTGTTNNIRTISYANMVSETVTIKASITEAGIDYTDYVTIIKVREGSDALYAILTNESVNLPANNAGVVSDYTGASTEIKVYQGATDVTSQWTISRVNGTGVLSTITASTVTVTDLTVPAAIVTINATKGLQTLSKIFNISRTTSGAAGGTGPRNAQVYYYYSTSSATAPAAQTTTQVAYNFSSQAPTTTAANWSPTFSPSAVTGTTSASNKYWAQKVVFQESVFGGAYTATVSPVFTWQNMDGLVTFTNLATNKNSQGLNATFIDGGSIITGTLTADKISSGVANLTDPVLPGSFAFGDTEPTVLGNTRAVGKFVVNTNNGWAFSAINNFTGTTGNWANGGFFATRAQNGAALGGYSVAAQLVNATNLRTAFICGEHNTALYGLCSKDTSYSQSIYDTNMNALHRVSDGFIASRTGAAGGSWYGPEAAYYRADGSVIVKNGYQFGNDNGAGYIFSTHTSGVYQGSQKGLIQFLPIWAPQFAIHIAAPSDNPAYINAGIRSPGGVSPFTGVHELQANSEFEIGDILVDKTLLNKSNISNTHYEAELSSIAEQKTVIGIYAGFMSNSILSVDDTPEYQEEVGSGGVINVRQIQKPPMKQAWMLENTIQVNALGEGQVNVCGENGNINAGDLIVTSSVPGKGMKQTDDIIRNITVAKARESVVFTSPNDIKQIACIYMCG